MRTSAIYGLILLCLSVAADGATEYFVRTDGNDASNGLSWADAKASIQAAVDAATDGDTVSVSNGTYLASEPAPSYALVLTNAITVSSVNGRGVTIIDAGWVNERRVARVDADGAVLDGFTLTRGYNNSWTDNGGPAALSLEAGLVTNCIVTASRSYRRGAVYVNGGTLTDCIVHGNTSGSTCPGGVEIHVGAVLNCTISNNATAWNGNTGGGLYVAGGMVSNSLISVNTVGTAARSGGARGGGVYQTGGSIVNCRITENISYDYGGAVYQAGGILRNSVLAHNNGSIEGGGLYLTAGAVENCTVVGNDTALGDGDGIWMSGGTVSNSIAYRNTGNNLDQNGGSVAYSCIAPLPAGDGNLGDDPDFVDPVNENYRLSVFSPCANTGSNQSWMAGAVDLDGNARLVSGSVDMGAYERSAGGGGPLQCTFSAPTNTGVETLNVTFTAQVAGDDTNNVTYTWDFGDTTGATGTDKRVVSHTYGPGYFTVVLTVSNAIAETATKTRTEYIQVLPLTCYVSTTGSNISPYETWERAATSVESAVSVAASTVLISNGTYSIGGEGIVVNRDMAIRGVNGPEVTILDAGGVSPRRIFLIDAPGARIEGVTAANGKWNSFTSGGGALRVLSGLVTNCIISGSGSYAHGAVYLGGGTLTDSIVRNGNSLSGGPGGVYIAAGALVNCAITNNTTGNNGSSAGGLAVYGGSVSNCLIGANTGLSTAAGGVYQTDGLIVSCEITDNISAASGGGIRQTGGILRNALLTGNNASVEGGGLYLTAGAAENCTVVKNDTVLGDGDGIWMSGGTVSNSIAYLNTGNNLHTNGGSVAYSCIAPVPAGDGNLGDDPAFEDAPNDDYRLSTFSPCVDAGSNQLWMAAAVDLDGNARLVNGSVDMGAYERSAGAGDSLQCTFSAPTNTGLETLDVTLTAQVTGDNTNNLLYTWDFGDSTGTSGSDKKVVGHTYGPGYFTVALTVSNDIAETATQTRPDYIQVLPTTCYVSTNGSNIAPYETWERAATSVADAVAVGAPTVLISNGTYAVSGEGIAVGEDMTIRGVNGPEVTILDAGGVSPRRIFLVSSPGARIEGITAANGKWNSFSSGGGALRVLSGLVTNCIISGSGSYAHGAVYLGGGTLTDSIVRNGNSLSGGPGGVVIDAGALVNCAITNNTTGNNGSSGGGISVAGGTVSNCLISANTGLWTAAGGVYETGGLIVSCEITDNISAASGGGIRQTGGILRNALLTGNSASAEGGGLYLTAGAVENCTVVGNDTVAGDGIWMSGGTVSNSIAYFNDGNNLDQNGGSVAYSCIAPLPAGDGNLGDDPAFVDAPNRDYRLSDVSPCVDAGVNQTWMADAPDLDGNPRIGGRLVDMGAYELPPPLGTVILMR